MGGPVAEHLVLELGKARRGDDTLVVAVQGVGHEGLRGFAAASHREDDGVVHATAVPPRLPSTPAAMLWLTDAAPLSLRL
ncbi:hypothetical protein GCM10009766_17690 [Microcella frigidaquae]